MFLTKKADETADEIEKNGLLVAVNEEGEDEDAAGKQRAALRLVGL